MSSLQAVIFDAFGTIVRIAKPTHPFKTLLMHGRAQGLQIDLNDAAVIMTNPFNLERAAAHFGIDIPSAEMALLQSQLDAELETIEPFPDAADCISTLKATGIKVAICSNLAMPYGAVVDELWPGLDAYGYSYAVGALKPDPRIYAVVLERLGVAARSAWMIGDSQRCDRDGPTEIGIKGHFLRRSQAKSLGDFSELAAFTDTVLRMRLQVPHDRR
ncbi:HAD family hydrolase [Aquipseudomonas ullengensis]|uniref:HAD family hydrolase n=1 Tax=Aquipseudomonas ullengensis TaxID=2759166 RepID=A0A7W4LNP3_9GAMM|nr:HAD family hydrolase [Pseudomonas ullengensis]MBB2496483.1 HAD family hydrolase [Pseudomonas ullengensis]